MNLSDKIYIAGHTGLDGSAILRCLHGQRYSQFLLHTVNKCDLTRRKFFEVLKVHCLEESKNPSM